MELICNVYSVDYLPYRASLIEDHRATTTLPTAWHQAPVLDLHETDHPNPQLHDPQFRLTGRTHRGMCGRFPRGEEYSIVLAARRSSARCPQAQMTGSTFITDQINACRQAETASITKPYDQHRETLGQRHERVDGTALHPPRSLRTWLGTLRTWLVTDSACNETLISDDRLDVVN